MSERYTLTAELDGVTRRHTVDALNDGDAMMTAIPIILDSAIGDKTWARGRIELTRADGSLVESMDAKGEG